MQFNTRHFYNKKYCKKCWNNIRMGTAYRILHPIKRIIYVIGNTQESRRQWVIRNRVQHLISKNNSNHKRRFQSQQSDITSEWLKNLKEKSKICPLCKIRMVKNGQKLNGKTLDHKTPLHSKGKHIKKNVWIVCRLCNIKKGKKHGKDVLNRRFRENEKRAIAL